MQSIRQGPFNWRFHILFWCLFILYEIGVSYTFNRVLSNFFDYGGHYILNISLFYFHAYVTLDYALTTSKPKRFLLLIGLIVLELAAYLFTKYWMLSLLSVFNIETFRPFVSLQPFIIESGWRAIYFLVLSSGYWFALSVVKQREKIADMQNIQLRNEIEKQKLENAFLQSQINPHFLFNTLTFLYTSINRLSPKLAESVLLLSDVMRYSLKGPGEDGKTSLEEEIEHMHNFIQLNQARFENELQLDYQVEGDPDGLRIIPLALLTFIENVFKYGDLKDAADPARIYIHIQGQELILNLSNKIKASRFAHSHGIGIENVRKRLDVYYNNRYILNVDSKENHYHLNLIITL